MQESHNILIQPRASVWSRLTPVTINNKWFDACQITTRDLFITKYPTLLTTKEKY